MKAGRICAERYRVLVMVPGWIIGGRAHWEACPVRPSRVRTLVGLSAEDGARVREVYDGARVGAFGGAAVFHGRGARRLAGVLRRAGVVCCVVPERVGKPRPLAPSSLPGAGAA